MFEYLHIYKQGEELSMPSNIDDRDKYMFYLIAKFEELMPSQRFALAESKLSLNKWKMYCVCKAENENEGNYPYFLCEVLNLQEVLK